jgi:hypothetical protein
MAKSKNGSPPAATSATTATREPTSREEIEDALDDVARETIEFFGTRKALPGWHILIGDVKFAEVGSARIRTVTTKRAAELVALAETNAHAFDAASYLAGMQFGIGHLTEKDSQCPEALRIFGARLLCGEIKRPVQSGRPRADDVPLRLAQYVLCRFVAEITSLTLSRNREGKHNPPKAFSACDAVAEAFSRAGRHTTQAQLASLCYDAAHADIRALADALNMLDFGIDE